jgi:biotin carboxylase
MNDQLTILCVASYEKGQEFMKQCKAEGCRVILLTSKSLEQADWPRESIDEIFYIPDIDKEWNMQDVIFGVSFLARTEKIDRIVALDDFDVEKAASLREHLRCAGMGETTARYFRDKLAMRMRAEEVGITLPKFVHILNHKNIQKFLENFPPPYVLKPRLQAGAVGIKKINSANELWSIINKLGDKQSFFLLEQFIPGDIYHVDTIIYKNEVEFVLASKYGLPPMEVAHEGRVFSTRTLPRGSSEEKELFEQNKNVLKAFGLRQGVSHTEFIKSKENGKFYFLETSARVGGANIADLVEAASGINLWKEWAKIECLSSKMSYEVPSDKKVNAGLIISLARQEYPDLSSYNESEICWRMNKKHHAGLVFSSDKSERIEYLLRGYTERFYTDFFASQPISDKPVD